DLRQLAADLRLGRVAELRLSVAFGRERHVGRPLAEAGDAALPFEEDRVARWRLHVLQLQVAGEAGVDRTHLHGDAGHVGGVAGALERLAAGDEGPERLARADTDLG